MLARPDGGIAVVDCTIQAYGKGEYAISAGRDAGRQGPAIRCGQVHQGVFVSNVYTISLLVKQGKFGENEIGTGELHRIRAHRVGGVLKYQGIGIGAKNGLEAHLKIDNLGSRFLRVATTNKGSQSKKYKGKFFHGSGVYFLC